MSGILRGRSLLALVPWRLALVPCWLALAPWWLALAPAAAQAADQATLTAESDGSSTQLVVTIGVTSALPESWVGWVVDRTTLGVCEPVVQVRAPAAFPATVETYRFHDSTFAADRAYKYRIRAVDAQGNRDYLGYGGSFPPAYYQTAYAMYGNAVAVRGQLTGSAQDAHLEPCAGQCWEPVMVFGLPSALRVFVNSGVVMDLRGTLADEFEGPYLTDITGWTLRADCGLVADEAVSWGAVKAIYR